MLESLAPPGVPITEADTRVPSAAGLYAIYGDQEAALQLGLSPAGTHTLLYVGKAEDSLVTRDLRTHFTSGRTGKSTVRRSFAALLSRALSLRATPRNPLKPGYFHMFGLDSTSEARLTEWMQTHLNLAVWPSPPQAMLKDIEEAVLATLDPPLNIAAVPTPRATLQAARARMADEARAWRPS